MQPSPKTLKQPHHRQEKVSLSALGTQKIHKQLTKGEVFVCSFFKELCSNWVSKETSLVQDILVRFNFCKIPHLMLGLRQ